jgi:hypothetical protein
MSIYQEAIPYDEFNPMKDKIAVMLRAFTIRRGVGLGDRKYSEPYFICIAIPESGNAKLDKVELSTRYHPKTRRGVKQEMAGEGIQIYGPANPGEYLAFSILVMESDEDVRKAGETIEELVKSNFAKALGKVVAGVATPTAAVALEVAERLVREVARLMSKDKDDELFYLPGSLLRDVLGEGKVPYQVQEVLTRSNDHVELEIQVLPIDGDTKSRKKSRTVKLK